jgi:hypothetical protein
MNKEQQSQNEGANEQTEEKGSGEPAINPFKETGQKGDDSTSPAEEAEKEQQYKEALTERD